MGNIGNILWITTILFFFTCTKYVLSDCVLQHICHEDDNGHKQSCVAVGENKVPTPLKNETGKSILQKICPMIVDWEDEPGLCCDTEQIIALQGQYDAAATVFKRCPSCMYNLATEMCHFACSPYMDEYLEVVSTSVNDKTGKEYANEINIFMDAEFMDGLFYACSEVILPSLGERAMDTSCGGYTGDDCTPERWFDYSGSLSNPVTPMRIYFKRTSHTFLNYKAFNPATVKCYEPVDNTSSPCSCIDCSESCPSHPEYPESDTDFTIVGADGYIFIAVALYIVITAVFFIGLCVKRKKSTMNYENFGEEQQRKIKPSIIDKIRFTVEKKLEIWFAKWGTGVAENPVLVIAIASWCVAILSYGIQYLEVTTDPVKIWASPNSQSRIEKDYFESRFEPFYRSEQIFFKAVGLPNIVHQTSDGPIEFGPAFHKEFLLEVLNLQQLIEAIPGLVDICFAPLSLDPVASKMSQCTVQSIWGYFQNDVTIFNKTSVDQNNYTINYLNHISSCFENSVNTDCLAPYGGNVIPAIAVGGFLQYGNTAYEKANGIVVTYVVNNHLDENMLTSALEWETKFIEVLQNYTKNQMPSFMDIAFRAERSIEDELERESVSEAITVVISYVLMFIYISLALGSFNSFRTMLVGSKIGLGLGGIVLVLLSISSCLGIFGYARTPTTLLTVEVIPFLVLAVGVDNMFILVTHHERNKVRGKSVPETVGKTLGEVGPSLILTTYSEAACFALGAITDMPAVKTFALYATVALVIDFILQMTVFTAFIALNSRRSGDGRMDLLCCVKIYNLPLDNEYDSLLHKAMVKIKPIIFNSYFRRIVILVFLAWFCASLASIPHTTVGLDQRLSMPTDSYVYKSFVYMDDLLSMGPPVYFVLKSGLNFNDEKAQNLICGGFQCNDQSLSTQIYTASRQSNLTYIAVQASSWLDDFIDWSTVDGCCKQYPNGTFCSHDVTEGCISCDITFNKEHTRPDANSFQTYFPFFLQDNPDVNCAKAGHAAYYQGVNYLLNNKKQAVITDTFFMAYHTTLKTSEDYYTALRMARYVAKNITSVIKESFPENPDVEVFPYSVFYVYYEQYLNIWNTSFQTIGISLVAVFVVTFIFTAFDLLSSLIVLCTVLMIVTDIAALMYWWDINLNAISLVNLVMSVGISVEFCSHIVHSFNYSPAPNKFLRAQDAFINMGSSVLSGITLTKFLGIIVLAFSKTQLFRVFYFRMYLGIVLFGAAHGLIFLPVLLSYVGAENEGLRYLRMRIIRRNN